MRVAHFVFEITLLHAIMLTLLLVCSFSPRVHSIPRGPRILLHENPSSEATKNPTKFVGFLWQRTLTLIETILRGCNSRSEGVHFSSKGGCSSRFEGVHYSTREDSIKPRALNLRSFHFCWDSSLDFCAALEFECHPSVRPGGIFYGFAKLFNFSVTLPSNKRNCRQKRTQRNGQSIQHEQKRHQI